MKKIFYIILIALFIPLSVYAFDNEDVNVIDLAQGEELPDDFVDALFDESIKLLKNNEITLYDPLNGEKALINKVITPCSNQLFQDDPLRIMRAFRFSAIYNAELSSEIIDLIKDSKDLLKNVSGERIRDELFKTLSVTNSYSLMQLIDKTGIFEIILPELSVCHGVTQNEWHHLDVFDHTLLSLQKLETLLSLTPPYPWWSEFLDYLSENISGPRNYVQLLKFGILLHDIGKIPCKSIDPDSGKVSFHRHEVEGAKMMKDISERFRLSSKELSFLQNLVKNHMRPGIIIQQGINEKRLFRFYSECGRDGLGICLLCLADRFSALGDNVTDDELALFSAGIYQIMNEFYLQKQKLKVKPLLNGNDIMKILNLKPGPIIKEIIDRLEEAQFTGEISSIDDAVSYIKKLDINN